MSQRKVSAQQRLEICKRYKSGMTQTALGKCYGVSKARIQQFIKASGMNSDEGGRAEIKRQKHEALNRKFINMYGCTKEQFDAVRGKYADGVKSPLNAFNAQKRHASRRGVEWKLSFWEWWSIWVNSGRWDKRGRNVDSYCMCRKGDEGPYSVGNVYIDTIVHNSTLGKTLSLEKNTNHTFMHQLIHCAGGPALVASEIGVSPNYLSQSMLRNEIPMSWKANGKLQKIVSLTGGAYDMANVECEMNKGVLYG